MATIPDLLEQIPDSKLWGRSCLNTERASQ